MNKVGARTKKGVGGGLDEKPYGHVEELRLSGRHSRPEEGRMGRRNRNLYYQGEEMKEGNSGQRERVRGKLSLIKSW